MLIIKYQIVNRFFDYVIRVTNSFTLRLRCMHRCSAMLPLSVLFFGLGLVVIWGVGDNPVGRHAQDVVF